MKYNDKGEELPDDRPIEVPLNWKRPPTLRETIASMIRAEDFRRAAEAHGIESFEEANDFGEDEDDLPLTPYEVVEMQDEVYDSDRAALARERRKDGSRKVAGGKQESEAGVDGVGRAGKKDSDDGSSGSKVAGADSGKEKKSGD